MPECIKCQAKLKMKAAFICEPCARIEYADTIAQLPTLLNPKLDEEDGLS